MKAVSGWRMFSPVAAGLALLFLVANSSASAVVFLYHHVDDGTPSITSIAPANFDAQMQYLKDGGFTVLPLDEILLALKARRPLPASTVAITFDDAYTSIHTHAFPRLRQLGFPFTVFVATALVGSSPRYLTWHQLAEMKNQGALIANHTRNHVHLLRRLDGETADQWASRITEEITGAQADIESRLGASPALFAFPYGEFDPAVMAIPARLGYTSFGQHSGAIGPDSDFRALPRFPIAGRFADIESFRLKARTLPMPLMTSPVNPLLPPGQVRPVLEFTLADGSWRISELACYGPTGRLDMIRNDRTIRTQAKADLPVGRSRYNCTMPSTLPGRYYWYSQPWIRMNPDGSWYAEP